MVSHSKTYIGLRRLAPPLWFETPLLSEVLHDFANPQLVWQDGFAADAWVSQNADHTIGGGDPWLA